jgi:hypothetical protein
MVSFYEDEFNDGFEPVIPGKYCAEVVGVKTGQTIRGDEMWTLEFYHIHSGKHLCVDNLSFSDGAKIFTFNIIETLGIKRNYDGLLEVEPDDLVGCLCALTLIVEEHNGERFLKPDSTAKGFGYEKRIPHKEIPSFFNNN